MSATTRTSTTRSFGVPRNRELRRSISLLATSVNTCKTWRHSMFFLPTLRQGYRKASRTSLISLVVLLQMVMPTSHQTEFTSLFASLVTTVVFQDVLSTRCAAEPG